MVNSELSFWATEQFRKRLLASNLEPYFVVDSKTPSIQNSDVGTRETQWIDVPLVDQVDLDKSGTNEKIKLNVVNQYGPDDGFKNSIVLDVKSNKPNEGEFNFRSFNTKKFDESETQQTELLVTNQFAPQDGWKDISSEFENQIREFEERAEYFTFVSSTYSSSQILLTQNPIGSDGLLSQDSSLAKIGATNLRRLFQESIAIEIYQETIGRNNLLASQTDPYLGFRIATGRASIIEPDWSVSVPDTLIGKGLDFISRITGVYSPFSWIGGDYFAPVQPKSFFNQLLNSVAGNLGLPGVLPERRNSSDIFLANTGGGTSRKLFGLLELNQFSPDYRLNFINDLNFGAPAGNYYIGSRTSEPLDIVSPIGFLPLNEFGIQIQTSVFGNSVLGKLYENNIDFDFGLNTQSDIDGGSLQGGFTWVSPKYRGNAGFNVGRGGDPINQDEEFPSISAGYNKNESTTYDFKRGSILDDTQRLINSQPNGGRRLEHVGNAIDQVSKVFNDGYKEMTKGSRVLRYTTTNGIFVGSEYGRVFAKDVPYYGLQKLQKTDGNIRKNPYSVLDKTYNLNMYPTFGQGSTSIVGGQVKKYMLSIENLAWRTSRRPGLRYTDLPESEKGPNGGRIMWFPPYDVTFNDSNSVNWEGNEFLGRPEQIYTYRSSTRSGTLSFQIIVDHPSVMNLVVNNVLSNQNSSQLSDQVLESFFAGLTKFDVYELAKRYNNFSQTELGQIQEIINGSSNRERVKDTINNNLNRGGDGGGGSMTSNSSVGLQNYTPQLSSFISSQFYFDQDKSGDNYETSLSEYQDNVFYSGINSSLLTNINSSLSNLQNLGEQINKLLESNSNINIRVILKANSNTNESNTIKQDRNNNIETTLKSLTKNNQRLVITKTQGVDDETIEPINYKCNTPITATTDNYGTGPVGCRRVIISDIIETPLPNSRNPNGGVVLNDITEAVDSIGNQTNLNRQINNVLNNNLSETEQPLSKAILRRLLNESNYFELIKETNPFVYNSIREKLKYFHPAFHSMTPEGLNSRLTFLAQCTRPGDTIPTKKADGTFIDKDARNTGFGAPPVCVLRVGDFYNSKVIIDSVNFTYDDAKFDLNPEGIGVQPMIVKVSLGFKFIGGQSLKGPIDELQNALSFNFFANTEMYDERATVLGVSAYDREFIETTEPTGDTPRNTNTTLANEGGSLIGDIDGSFDNSGTTANNNYKQLFNDLLDNMETFNDGVIDKLEQVSIEYNAGILKLFTSNRGNNFTNGNFDEFGTKEPRTIFGKSNYTDNITSLFSSLLNDVQADSLTLISEVKTKKNDSGSNNLKTYKKNIENLINSKKSSFTSTLDNISNELSNSQLPVIRSIDKINYVLQGNDGYIDKQGNPIIFSTTSGNTITDLKDNSSNITGALTQVIQTLIDSNIITSGYNNNQTYNLITNSFNDNNSDKRFYLVFANDLINNLNDMVDKLMVDLPSDWRKDIISVLDKPYRSGSESEKKAIKDLFKKYKKENKSIDRKYGVEWNKWRKDDRENSLVKVDNPSDNLKTRLKNLYLGENVNNDKTFNGKVTF
jgi:hypothetical protein